MKFSLSMLPAIAAAMLLPAAKARAEERDLVYDYSHGFEYLWPLKYPADFDHFDHVNPDAPWLGLTGFCTLAVTLTLLIFVGEAIRDAFDPRKLVQREQQNLGV